MLTQDEAQRDPILQAVWSNPGISRTQLAEQGIIRRHIGSNGDRLQTLVIEGKLLPKDGGYFPYTPEHLPTGRKGEPPLKVWKDPSIVNGGATRAAAVQMEQRTISASTRVQERAIAEEYRATAEVLAPVTGLQIEADQECKPEPAPTARASETVSEARAKTKRSLEAERRCKEAIAQLEADGQPFTRNKIALLAGVGRGYFSANTRMRQIADEAIARCAGKSPGEVDQPVPIAQGKLPGHHQEEPEVLQIAPEPPQADPDIPEQVITGQGEAEKRLSEVVGAIAAEREKAVKEQDFLKEEIEELTNLYKAAERQQEFCDRLLKTLGVEA